MDIAHGYRHTRRGFLRGDSTPQFFKSSAGSSGAAGRLATASGVQNLMPPPPPSPATWIEPQFARTVEGEESAPLFEDALEAGGRQNSSNAFLVWLAEQITGEAHGHRNAIGQSTSEFDYENFDEGYDPYIDGEFSDFGTPPPVESAVQLDFSITVDDAAQVHEEIPAYCDNPFARARWQPIIECSPDGGRCECFAAGSKIVKDVLGRVVEVHSQFGDCLYFRYGVLGNLEHFERTDAHGRRHSEGRKDKHGVVVRDYEGRVRAAGETMAVDPSGCFYVHAIDGQYVSLDLVNGTHTERRRLRDSLSGTTIVITSLFTHDGFRMATAFSGTIPPTTGASTSELDYFPSRFSQDLRFRFYGRDGTLIEFASEEDLRRLQPVRVSAPATRKVARSWQRKRQAGTAWDSVHEYLMRVS